MLIFDADHPLVLNGTYDREGYTPKERRALLRKTARQPKGPTMRLFDTDAIGCYLDDIGHRVEKTKDGNEYKMVDLTLRVQPFTPELAAALDPGVRALLFSLNDGEPKPMLKAVHFNLTVVRQALQLRMSPEFEVSLMFSDVEITGIRARTEKGVDGFALVFYASFGPVSATDLEYIQEWLTQQRFISFHPQSPALDFDADPSAADAPPEPPRRRPRGNLKQVPVESGDELRPGVHAEH